MKKLFWIDLEMTGLDEKTDVIIEVAVIVTDLDFNALETYNEAVFQNQTALDGMDDWCKKTHGESGLTERVKTGKPLAKTEEDLLAIVARHFASDERVVLCGNSVGNDKRFIDKYMPTLAKKLHYRILDVSSFKVIFKSKYNIKFEKKKSHKALEDIQESINEIKAYLSHVHIQK